MRIEEQFAYVIPFLGKILEETYPPSQERIDAWMKGGSSRLSITSNPVQGGHLAEVEWDTFSALVKYWALPGIDKEGQEVPQEAMAEDGNDLPHTAETRLRPRGSQRYEELSNYEKLMFVHDVLTGEAVIQLLIIRGGHRTNLELLDEQREVELYAIGKSMSNEESTSSVVRNVLERRKDMRKALRLEAETSYEENGDAMIDEEEEIDKRIRTRASRYAINKI
ncbi:hypothetical protein CPB86DRAFT_693758 [Serendipita vermifera]|nr:hypothetical protein CPB86DRAFT_693758 [Serendipita vermifera]